MVKTYRTGVYFVVILLVNHVECRSRCTGIYNLANSSLSHRVIINYWNKLPCEVKFSRDVNVLKVNLENYKKVNILSNQVGHFWEVSVDVLNIIEGPNYLENKLK